MTTGEMVETVQPAAIQTRHLPRYYLDTINENRQYIQDDVVRHASNVANFQAVIDKNQAALDACIAAGLPDPRV